MRTHRVYCKSVSEPNERFEIDESQSHHLIKALRLKEGDVIEVFDGEGRFATCKIIEKSKKSIEAKRIGELKYNTPPKRLLVTIIPVIKKNNFNFMIQKLAEIGANKFIVYKPDYVDQSVAKKDITRMINKSLEILINVSKQCGNNFLPEVLESNSLEEAITMTDNTSEIYSFDTEATEYFNQEGLGENSSITIITGPESGFSDKELKSIKMHNIKERYLGQNILRAETAPIYVSSLIKNHFGKIL
mgnify:FL=1